ncbi:unnamed protein product [Darwinula stevensoni]|uniref:AIG1-type G domain-containing protein n=1 Tax=Darwinula stevensoni TaxID=69355 RepID=A0A7R8X8E1_9CRUS|nr:unnamed protein product [Darwinula stevensoni]CAG0887844.1 unnamed protein product [Darwinula stevensoni]
MDLCIHLLNQAKVEVSRTRKELRTYFIEKCTNLHGITRKKRGGRKYGHGDNGASLLKAKLPDPHEIRRDIDELIESIPERSGEKLNSIGKCFSQMETIYGKNLTEEVVEAEDKKQKDPFISMAHDLQYETTEAFSHDKEESENGERSCSNVMPSKILKNSASKGRQRKAFKRSNVERKSGKTTLAEEMKKMAKLCQKGRDGKPDIYELPKLPELHHENGRKTTMINGLANYVYGVRWEDGFRFRISTEKGDLNVDDRANSQTKEVTAYSFNWQDGMIFPYTLVVIDTPGFGDSEGIHNDMEHVFKMREFFELSAQYGIVHIHGVGFVLPSSSSRLTATEKYIFHSVTQLFGIDTKEKFMMLLSFCDGGEPLAIQTLKSAQFFYCNHYTFNNSALFAGNNDALQKKFWEIGINSNNMFLEHLSNTAPVSLALTKEVLTRREGLVENLKRLEADIREVSSKISNLQDECKQLKMKKSDVSQILDLVKETIKIPLEVEVAINCSLCRQTTCEYPATVSKPKDIKESTCMDPDMKFTCRKCGCSWKSHQLERKRYVFNVAKYRNHENPVKPTKKNIQLPREQKLRQLTIEILKIQVELLARVQQAHSTAQRLKEIALNPNPLPLEEYIDFLIDAEKKNHEVGFAKRIEQLEQVKQVNKVWMDILGENDSDAQVEPPDDGNDPTGGILAIQELAILFSPTLMGSRPFHPLELLSFAQRKTGLEVLCISCMKTHIEV